MMPSVCIHTSGDARQVATAAWLEAPGRAATDVGGLVVDGAESYGHAGAHGCQVKKR